MTTTTEPTAPLSAGDTFLSLNGFEEIGIATAFHAPVTDLRDQPITFLRALVFVCERRRGSNHADAHKAAMTMTITEVQSYFPEDEDEVDPADPETEAGKDG